MEGQEQHTTSGSITIRGARDINLKNFSLDIPKRMITVFTGVSGSGKSSLVSRTIAAESQRLINETYPVFVQQFMPHYGQPDADGFQNISAAIVVDQQRLGGNSRSTMATVTDSADANTATYAGIRDNVCKAFAKASKVDPALFSSKSKGACPDCNGLDVIYTDLAHLDPMVTRCETCQGRRFTDGVLQHELRGRSISDAYEMSVADAAGFFSEPAIARTLQGLVDVGLWLPCARAAVSTLSSVSD